MILFIDDIDDLNKFENKLKYSSLERNFKENMKNKEIQIKQSVTS